MTLYDDAMRAALANKVASQKRTRDNLNSVIDFLDTIETDSPVGSSGSVPNNGPQSSNIGGSIRNQMEGRGPSSGPIPQMKTWYFNGKPVTTAKGTKKYFKPFLKELAASGYNISSLGGYNYRNARGSNRLSEHAYGDALDINPEQNPMGSNLVTNMPANIAALAKKHGLIWGGTWKSKKDPMHFSITGY